MRSGNKFKAEIWQVGINHVLSFTLPLIVVFFGLVLGAWHLSIVGEANGWCCAGAVMPLAITVFSGALLFLLRTDNGRQNWPGEGIVQDLSGFLSQKGSILAPNISSPERDALRQALSVLERQSEIVAMRVAVEPRPGKTSDRILIETSGNAHQLIAYLSGFGGEWKVHDKIRFRENGR